MKKLIGFTLGIMCFALTVQAQTVAVVAGFPLNLNVRYSTLKEGNWGYYVSGGISSTKTNMFKHFELSPIGVERKLSLFDQAWSVGSHIWIDYQNLKTYNYFLTKDRTAINYFKSTAQVQLVQAGLGIDINWYHNSLPLFIGFRVNSQGLIGIPVNQVSVSLDNITVQEYQQNRSTITQSAKPYHYFSKNNSTWNEIYNPRTVTISLIFGYTF